ncbi:phosphatidate cytidylyltransferase [Cnuella takakiae]|uniref:Phosphatidate cytidylyltransferase n=1 Tax=Cnuella takakiae TaxID=1302690 RepID=A0A1M5ESM2_9BACT|nr:phosphatidate cytidylyltransferase [Cnuella takakiae]OLY91284.1 hypothetical protein BUE76_04735 [Cnuella takakiae]SHF82134.1 phosphatidate cytidylyltransferase [Cnuella takakiae]
MAFNKEVFRTRALSAIVFVVIMAVGLLWSELSFILLFAVVHVGCWFEYQKLVLAITHADKKTSASLFAMLMLGGLGLLLLFTRQSTLMDFGKGMLSTSIVVSTYLLITKRLPKDYKLGMLAGLLYLSLSLALLVNMRTQDSYPDFWWSLYLPLLIIVNNWINDTMAYIVGSFIGKTPFSPISPKKTWEGTIGGVILAVITITLVAHFTGWLPLHHAAALSAIGAISGTYGDLFESKLKRMAGVKDSGTMMPGHGGFLDRFDSLLFSATACAVYVWGVM